MWFPVHLKGALIPLWWSIGRTTCNCLYHSTRVDLYCHQILLIARGMPAHWWNIYYTTSTSWWQENWPDAVTLNQLPMVCINAATIPNYWLCWNLSKWQLPFQPVTKISFKTTFPFQFKCPFLVTSLFRWCTYNPPTNVLITMLLMGEKNNAPLAMQVKLLLQNYYYLPGVPYICVSQSDQHWFR